jgi:hypothetical protein
MKNKFGFSQFVSQNTPLLAQKIGDISLICAALAVSILGFPTMMAEAGFTFVLPLFLLKIAKVLAAIGIFGKIITKMMGKTTDAGVPISTTEQAKLKEAEVK